MDSSDKMYSKLFTDMMSEGFIAIDDEGIIQIYNDSAKEIFGISSNSGVSHKAGKLKEGDLIIIANNSFGIDDGCMNKESLKLLGLEGNELKKGDSFILISKYKEESIFLKKSDNKDKNINIFYEYNDMDISSFIDIEKKVISISVDGMEFKLDYINEIGHMVILDDQKNLKFYQTNGYTARRESINDILNGKTYKGKGDYENPLNVIGENIFDIHNSESIIQDFYSVAKGKNLKLIDKHEIINGYPTLCTLKAIEIEGDRKGAALIVEDISKIEEVIRERDNILRELEKTSKTIKEKKEFNRVFPKFIGEDEKILEVKRMALRASKTMSPVLLVGQPGVGKSLLAKSIYEASNNKDHKFIHLDARIIKDFNCIENNATIYIENIDRLNLDLQGKLLDILEDNINYNNLKIITSTNKNLDKKVISEEFRDDLYYRINIISIYIPALKERKSDIKLLLDYLLPKICKKVGTENKRVSMEAMDLINSYHWPDNVRELENILERAVNYAFGNNILTKHIVLLGDMQKMDDRKQTLKEALEEREKTIIQSTLSLHKGDRKKTIKDLGISQSTFYEKLNKYDIN